ncbi:MAG: hypothetical protein CVV64_11290 [Candidatus Wallbacteria bacterium HGW-Wallbacteria-1]|jgi:hypothetical protein|uniref:Uncharacterized protein n=1 Tax=Candidatus Wallbacteria bacterium HGW-Wallbacteria-1 TaxID=2013854 RepID=A0A2N1PP27_9BACT|nr:MAG: hypothetical protein CVV64_11290 [Candidatus Wallbacteria bacterium HGW-Wallbacteria-1]
MNLQEIHEQLNRSSFYSKVKDAASDFFDLWCENILNYFPAFTGVPDRSQLASDMMYSFARGLNDLFKDDKCHEHMFSPVDFLRGYVSTDLSTEWYGRFLFPQSVEYVKIMALKAVVTCIDLDADFAEKILSVQKGYLNGFTDWSSDRCLDGFSDESFADSSDNSETSAVSVTENTPSNLLVFPGHINKDQRDFEQSRNFMHDYFSSLLNDEISRGWVKSCREKIIVVSLKDIFADDELKKLIIHFMELI